MGTSPFRRTAVYRRCLRCASAPRRPLSGSVLSLASSIDMSPSATTGSSSAAYTQFLHRQRWPSTTSDISALPKLPTLRFSWGDGFRGLPKVCVRYNLSICLPSCRSWPGFPPADEDFYFRAFDGLVTRSVAGYDYRGNWVSSTDGTFTR